MTHFEIKISIDEDKSLNEVTAAIHSALYAADLDPLGVSVEQFHTEPVYELEAADVAEARRHIETGFRSEPAVEDFIQALKENGDRYRG